MNPQVYVQPKIGSRRRTAIRKPITVGCFSVGELFGGVEEFLFTYAKYLRDNTNSTPVTILFERGPLFKKLRAAGLPVEVLHTHGRYDFSVVRQLRELTKRHGIQVLHVHGYKAAIVAALAARKSKLPIVKTEHGAIEPDKGWSGLKMKMNLAIDRWMSNHFIDQVVYITKDLMATKNCFGRNQKPVVIHNGIAPIPDSGAHKKYFDKHFFNVGIVGRLAEVKGHRFLIEAVAKMKEREDVRVHVFGEGPLENQIRRDIEAAGVSRQFVFHGFKTNIQDYMRELDVLVMPSLHEGLPYTLLEAMRLKVPVIAAAVGGLTEVLVDRKTALLFPAQDSEALARRLEQLQANPALGTQLASAAYWVADHAFNIGTMAQKYLDLYQEVIRERRSA